MMPKHINKTNRFSGVVCICLLLFSCSQTTNYIGQSLWGDSGTAVLTPDEIKKAQIQTSPVHKKLVQKNSLDNEAFIMTATSNFKYISAPLPGFLKERLSSPGEYVKKGQILAILEHDSYIQLQQDYLIAKTRFEYAREDFKRQGILTLEDATSIKKMQQAQDEYTVAESNLNALRLRLTRIGINPDSVRPETITSTIQVISSFNGVINQTGIECGKFVSEEDYLFEIIESGPLMLQMQVSISQSGCEIGDTISFTLEDKEKPLTATIVTIGFSSKSKDTTIVINARIISHDPTFRLKPGMKVHVKAYPYLQMITIVDPQCILFDPYEPYIIIAKEDTFKKFMITMGEEFDDSIELINAQIPEKYEVVTHWKNLITAE